MTYESVQTVSAMVGLIVFVVLFIAVLVFVFWPGNQKGFDEASRIPLEKDDNNSGDSNGR
jgi:cytochrome c oxidase cbb3-type subunit IV